MEEYSGKKEYVVYKARLSEQMERYEDMAKVCSCRYVLKLQLSEQLSLTSPNCIV